MFHELHQSGKISGHIITYVFFVNITTLLLFTANITLGAEGSSPQQGTTAQSSSVGEIDANKNPAIQTESGTRKHQFGAIAGAAGPVSHNIRGWRSKDTSLEEIGIEKLNTQNFASEISSLVGYNPFVVRTRAGQMPVTPGLCHSLKTHSLSQLLSMQFQDQLCVIIPSLPVQNGVSEYLSNQGVKVLKAVKPNGYVAKARPQDIIKLNNDPYVYWIGEIPWSMKIDPVLAKEYSIQGIQSEAIGYCPLDEDKVWISLYDINDKINVQLKLETEGLLIERFDEIIGAFLCRIFTPNKILTAANMPEVSFIQAPRIITSSLETSITLCGSHDIIRENYGYGENVIIGMIDSGFEIDHIAFMGQGTYPNVYGLGWNVSGEGVPDDVWNDNSLGHGTHVAGIMLSRWYDAHLDGMAPRTGGDENHRFRVVRCGRDTGSPTPLYNIDQAMDILAADNSALAINCSWGGIDNTGSDLFSVLADAYIWSNRQIYVVAAGNNGPTAGSINTPAAAKNVIAVGNVNNGTLALETDSSRGPTRDGRQKPDIYAPGQYVTSADANFLNGSKDLGGTSMATPHVTGFLATLLDHYPDFQRRPALTKAYLMATAQRQSWLPLQTGVLNSYDAHFSTSKAQARWSWFDDDPRPYTYVYFDLDDLPGNVEEMHIVMSWIEPPCFLGDYYTVLNDVDLWVDHGKDDGAQGEWSSTSGVDNVEYVRITDPPPGDYRIKAVKYSALTQYEIGYAVWYTLSHDVPTAPSDLSHIGNSTGSITWTWIDNSSNENGFRIHDSSHHDIWTTPMNSTSYTESNLMVNTQYERHIHAFNAYGESDPGNHHSAFTLAHAPGVAPFTHVTLTSLQVNWTANGNPAGTEFLCENLTSGANSGWTTMLFWEDSGLPPQTEYHYQVRARNGDGVETDIIDLGYQRTLTPAVIYVDKKAQSGANDGSSWNDAFTELQDALHAAQYGYEIRVSQGIYQPDISGLTDPREASFQLVKGVSLMGGYAGYDAANPDARDPNNLKTVLSGDLAGNDVEVVNPMDLLNDPCRVDNCYHVVNHSDADPNTILDGFTITAGNANGDWQFGYDKGGGIFESDGLLINCTFIGNSASGGGGGIFEIDGSLIYCTFIDNATTADGGAIYWNDGLVTNCSFTGNTATGGGAIYANFGPVNNCIFKTNIATSGGAILINLGLLTNSIFCANQALETGGGIHWSDNPITNCIFSGNKALSYGGAIFQNDGPVVNCTFTGNAAARDGGGIYSSSGSLLNSILWSNMRDAYGDSGGPYLDQTAQIRYAENGKINYCCMQNWSGNLGGLGNIDKTPLFVDSGYWDHNETPADPNDDFWVEGDYHLQSFGWRWEANTKRWRWDFSTSPGIDAGNPGMPLAHEWLIIPEDITHEWGENLRINMGAYGGTAEAGMPPLEWALRADLTNDGIVNLKDFTHLVHDWYSPDSSLPGDLNRDKACNILDLMLLMQEWLNETSWRN